MSVRELLSSFRWDVDQCVVNHFGERVWLKAWLDSDGKRIGITECCFADDACDHHRMSQETVCS